MRIVQMSDIHVGTGLFRPELLTAAIDETNEMEPDLVAIAGDLTMEGHRWEFEEAKEYLDRLECPERRLRDGQPRRPGRGLLALRGVLRHPGESHLRSPFRKARRRS